LEYIPIFIVGDIGEYLTSLIGDMYRILMEINSTYTYICIKFTIKVNSHYYKLIMWLYPSGKTECNLIYEDSYKTLDDIKTLEGLAAKVKEISGKEDIKFAGRKV
jgi:hypothetical protein